MKCPSHHTPRPCCPCLQYKHRLVCYVVRALRLLRETHRLTRPLVRPCVRVLGTVHLAPARDAVRALATGMKLLGCQTCAPPIFCAVNVDGVQWGTVAHYLVELRNEQVEIK